MSCPKAGGTWSDRGGGAWACVCMHAATPLPVSSLVRACALVAHINCQHTHSPALLQQRRLALHHPSRLQQPCMRAPRYKTSCRRGPAHPAATLQNLLPLTALAHAKSAAALQERQAGAACSAGATPTADTRTHGRRSAQQTHPQVVKYTQPRAAPKNHHCYLMHTQDSRAEQGRPQRALDLSLANGPSTSTGQHSRHAHINTGVSSQGEPWQAAHKTLRQNVRPPVIVCGVLRCRHASRKAHVRAVQHHPRPW